MDEEQLKAIEARAQASGVGLLWTQIGPQLWEDRAALLAEVRRLKAENAEMLGLLADKSLDSDLAAHAVRREAMRCAGILTDLMEREERAATEEPFAIRKQDKHHHAAAKLAHASVVILARHRGE